MSEDEKVDDSTIMDQLGIPIISVATEAGACLMYSVVEEFGNHMPEVRLNRELEVVDIALNW